MITSSFCFVTEVCFDCVTKLIAFLRCISQFCWNLVLTSVLCCFYAVVEERRFEHDLVLHGSWDLFDIFCPGAKKNF